MLDLKSLVPWGQKRNSVPVTQKDREFLDPFYAFRREMDRLFDDFFSNGSMLARRNGGNGWYDLAPELDIAETDKDIVVTAELPGVDQKDLEVTLAGDTLTIKGEKKYEHEENDEGRHYMERRYGSFCRTVRLPFEAGDLSVDAELKNGVLTVRVPKPAELRTESKRIEIHTA